MTINQARRTAYRVARDLGDVQAVRRGPTAVARRVVRKHAYRAFGKIMRGVLR